MSSNNQKLNNQFLYNQLLENHFSNYIYTYNITSLIRIDLIVNHHLWVNVTPLLLFNIWSIYNLRMSFIIVLFDIHLTCIATTTHWPIHDLTRPPFWHHSLDALIAYRASVRSTILVSGSMGWDCSGELNGEWPWGRISM